MKEIKLEIHNHFKKRFKELKALRSNLDEVVLKQLYMECRIMLEELFTQEEIKKVV